jgi:hypothetical protein
MDQSTFQRPASCCELPSFDKGEKANWCPLADALWLSCMFRGVMFGTALVFWSKVCVHRVSADMGNESGNHFVNVQVNCCSFTDGPSSNARVQRKLLSGKEVRIEKTTRKGHVWKVNVEWLQTLIQRERILKA